MRSGSWPIVPKRHRRAREPEALVIKMVCFSSVEEKKDPLPFCTYL